MSLLRQGPRYVLVGVAQLVLDWLVFVTTTACGLPVVAGNLAGRVCGALLGFWLHGRWTFAEPGQARLGWKRLLKFAAVWLALTAASTGLISLIAAHLGLSQAWLAKPLVEAALAALAFFLWRHLVYR
ncbi:MAG TPA: GtrA family protein [Pseudoxanthomonas sp.]|nr:GtrA family protein [Pseudoxanthomonas sp.]